jgi:xanthine dehydrogenase large subunit
MSKIEVEVLRLGGGFGGKEDQASPWAAMAALAAYKLKRPVKLILPRHDDMRMTGKRHPYSSDYKLGLKADGTIVALEATYYQNAGASADLSPAVLDRTLFHAANAYHIPNVRATGISCKTNLPSNTAFRGFGGPQGKFVIETAIFKASEVMGIPAHVIQKKNLLKENDEFHFGQKAKHCRARISWEKMEEEFKVYDRISKIEKYNSENDLMKKGYAFMPICFGISFTNTLMNQASALVNIYTDGSVTFSTAAVEMGQGVNAKIREVISRVLGISHEKIKTEPTNTSRAANSSPTAASAGADLNCNAAKIACSMLKDRLVRSAAKELNLPMYEITIENEVVCHNGKPTELKWNDLVLRTYNKRISLQAQAHYATPNIFFDRVTNKGDAFFYHVYGTAFIEVTVDCLKGTYQFNTVKVMHDFGESLNPIVDLGQAEGAIIQGLGWMTLEEIVYNKEGRLLSDLLSTYKVPEIHFAPEDMDVKFLGLPNPVGIMGTKAIGEPPLMYGIGGYFAIMNAVKAFRPGASFKISAPYTAEKVLMNLYSNANIDERISSALEKVSVK